MSFRLAVTLAAMTDAWRTQVAADWADALAPVAPTLAGVGHFLREELTAGRDYLPASDRILAAFERPMQDVRVLIVGQDPYPTPGDAMGLSFSVPVGRAMPRSLSNIARELAADEQTRDIPIVFLTARADPADRRLGEQLGGVGYVVKPFDPVTIGEFVESLLVRIERGERDQLTRGITSDPER